MSATANNGNAVHEDLESNVASASPSVIANKHTSQANEPVPLNSTRDQVIPSFDTSVEHSGYNTSSNSPKPPLITPLSEKPADDDFDHKDEAAASSTPPDETKGNSPLNQQPQLPLQHPSSPSEHGDSSHAHGVKHPGYQDLFFDLLFAANLNAYSTAVIFDDISEIAVFVGFFAAIWWAWWTQAYFDARYRMPSLTRPLWFSACQHLVRAVVLGLWVAFSTTPSEFARASFTNFSFIVGCSRLAFAGDHLLVVVLALSQRHRPTDQKEFKEPLWPHLTASASQIASALLWILSRYVVDEKGQVNAALLAMWLIGVALEACCQILNELFAKLSDLGAGVLPQRLVLFGLIVLGEGFVGFAETLNRISPGARRYHNDKSVPTGGWGAWTILQSGASVLIIVLQFSAYFNRAEKKVELRSVFIVLWAYVHVILHMSSAVLVIGLKKIIGFLNTVTAFERLLTTPQSYLPNTPQWTNITTDYIADLLGESGGLPSPFQIANDTVASTLASMIAVLQSNEGAAIPRVEEATSLMASVAGLVGGVDQANSLASDPKNSGNSHIASSQFGPSLAMPIKTYFEMADTALNPDSLDVFARKGLFQYKYIYLACAIFLTADIVIKEMQHRQEFKRKSFQLAMVMRFVFALVLVSVQVVFTVNDGAPSYDAMRGGLAICATILFVELMTQNLIEWLAPKINRPWLRRAKGNGKAVQRTSMEATEAPNQLATVELKYRASAKTLT